MRITKSDKFMVDKNLQERSNQEIYQKGLRDYADWLRRQIEYYRQATEKVTRYNLKAGEVFEFDFGINVNAETSNRHYGVVLTDSGPMNPIVLVMPLKSSKHGINKNSDLDIGFLPGLDTYSRTIAVVNQTRPLDKFRIYTKNVINANGTRQFGNDDTEDYYQLRLTDDQLKLCINAYLDYVEFGSFNN